MNRLVPQARLRYSTCSIVGFILILCAVFIFERLLSRFVVLTQSVQVTAKTLGNRVKCFIHVCTLRQDLVNISLHVKCPKVSCEEKRASCMLPLFVALSIVRR